MNDTDYVRLDSGEVGFIVTDYRYHSPKEIPSLIGKNYVMYFSLETSRRRHAYFDEDKLQHISEEEYIKILRGEEYKSVFESHSQRKHKERDSYIYKQRKNGRTYTSIGNQFGITSERVKQICDKEQRLERIWGNK